MFRKLDTKLLVLCFPFLSFACVLCRCRVASTSLIQAMYLHLIRTTLGLQQIVRDQVMLNEIELQQLPFWSGHGGTPQGSLHTSLKVYMK